MSSSQHSVHSFCSLSWKGICLSCTPPSHGTKLGESSCCLFCLFLFILLLNRTKLTYPTNVFPLKTFAKGRLSLNDSCLKSPKTIHLTTRVCHITYQRRVLCTTAYIKDGALSPRYKLWKTRGWSWPCLLIKRPAKFYFQSFTQSPVDQWKISQKMWPRDEWAKGYQRVNIRSISRY